MAGLLTATEPRPPSFCQSNWKRITNTIEMLGNTESRFYFFSPLSINFILALGFLGTLFEPPPGHLFRAPGLAKALDP